VSAYDRTQDSRCEFTALAPCHGQPYPHRQVTVMGISKTTLWLSIAGVCVLAALLTAVMPATGAAKAAESSSQITAAADWKIVPTDASRNVTIPDGCAYVRANLAKDADLGMKRVSCVTSFSAVTAAALPTLCHPRDEQYNRFADCIYSEWIDLIIDTKTGKVLGTVPGATILWNSLTYNSRSWQEHIQCESGPSQATERALPSQRLSNAPRNFFTVSTADDGVELEHLDVPVELVGMVQPFWDWALGRALPDRVTRSPFYGYPWQRV
jgi:hypothetical protein